MRCQNCGERLEREDHIEFIGELELPMTLYWCKECGLEARNLDGEYEITFHPKRRWEEYWNELEDEV